MADTNDDLDGAWKEAFAGYFEASIAFFLPHVHADIDWSRGFEFLDTQFQKLAPQSEIGRRSVDLLIRVWRRDGSEQWVLIHIEIQAQYIANLPKKIFQYYYRAIDLHDVPIASFVILADKNPRWKPQRLMYKLWGCELNFRFPVIKLTDLNLDQLQASTNPFAVIVLAHLEAMKTKRSPDKRKARKLGLIKSLYDRFGRDDVRKLARLIDWHMKLPKEHEQKLRFEIEQFEQEKKMPFITSFERLAKEEGQEIGEAIGEARGVARGEARGLREGIASALELKFGEVDPTLVLELQKIDDVDLLGRVLRSIAKTQRLAELRKMWVR